MFSISPKIEQPDLLGNISYINDLQSRDPIKLMKLLAEHIDLPTLIPKSFYQRYYSSNTNSRDYSLECMLSIVLMMHFFKVPTAKLMVFMLALSKELRSFCRVPAGLRPDEKRHQQVQNRFRGRTPSFL